MSGAKKAGNGALGGPAGASRASKGPGLFDPREFLWFLLLDQSIEASEAWFFHASRLHLQTKIIFLSELADPLGMKILEL